MRLVYDDEKGTRETSYKDGSEIIVSKARLDENGAILGLSTVVRGAEVTVDLVCTSDSHGNWTECKRWAGRGGESKLTGLWQRTLSYR